MLHNFCNVSFQDVRDYLELLRRTIAYIWHRTEMKIAWSVSVTGVAVWIFLKPAVTFIRTFRVHHSVAGQRSTYTDLIRTWSIDSIVSVSHPIDNGRVGLATDSESCPFSQASLITWRDEWRKYLYCLFSDQAPVNRMCGGFRRIHSLRSEFWAVYGLVSYSTLPFLSHSIAATTASLLLAHIPEAMWKNMVCS